MICAPCREAGEALRNGGPAIAKQRHEKCKDPLKCPCHHEIAPVEQIVASAARRTSA